MAVKEEFEIRISKNGEIKIIAKGFSGKECEIPLEKIRKLLDEHGLGKIEHSSEFYKTTETVDTKIKK